VDVQKQNASAALSPTPSRVAFYKTPGTRDRAGLHVPLQLALASCSLELKFDFHSRKEMAYPSATPFKVYFFLTNFRFN
jgi:hypothetical protein